MLITILTYCGLVAIPLHMVCVVVNADQRKDFFDYSMKSWLRVARNLPVAVALVVFWVWLLHRVTL